jgi:predicted GNAT family acetyltransferase
MGSGWVRVAFGEFPKKYRSHPEGIQDQTIGNRQPTENSPYLMVALFVICISLHSLLFSMYMQNTVTVTNNKDQMQFEVNQDGEKAVLQYRFLDNLIWLMHTEVPISLEGKGIASALAQYGLEWAKENQKKVKVICPFVAIYLKRHPEYNEIVVK